MRTKIYCLKVTVFIFCIVMLTNAWAEKPSLNEEPSLEDTLKWLKKIIEAHAGITYDYGSNKLFNTTYSFDFSIGKETQINITKIQKSLSS